MAQTNTTREDEVQFLTRKEVVAKVRVTFPTLWGWMRRGQFPLSRQIGGHRVGWLKQEVDDWMLGRPPQEYKPTKRRA
jgi:predicted DNA-binding transcriptional regulator AlpA